MSASLIDDKPERKKGRGRILSSHIVWELVKVGLATSKTWKLWNLGNLPVGTSVRSESARSWPYERRWLLGGAARWRRRFHRRVQVIR